MVIGGVIAFCILLLILAFLLPRLSRHPERLERAMEGRPEPGTAVASALASIAGAAGRRAILGAQ